MSDTEKVFPVFMSVNGITKTEGGMDLRDYFAAKAMQAFLSQPRITANLDVTAYRWAVNSYGMADEMLKARGNQ